MSGTESAPVSPARGFQLEVLRRLDDDETAAVTLLVERATEADGVRPLSEHVSLHLRYGGDAGVRHLLLYGDGRGEQPHLAGYAHLDVTDQVAGSSSELVVDPSWRRRGIGRALVEAVRRETPDGRLRLWAHGDHSAASRLASSLGYPVSRELWQMRRSLYAPLPRATVPVGVAVRAFVPGADDAAWVALNAAAFVNHPEQGSMTLDDLHRRMAEPWFDPAGFFLAERTDSGSGPETGQTGLVGFHWTKVHGGHGPVHSHDDLGKHEHDDHGHEPIGEVYVLGIHPSAQGQGLGRALTLIGLHHLRSLGLREVMLYVEAENHAAIAVYERLGFTHWDTDVMFTSPG
ncbi:MAG TPA: mycothiol synthase [Actinomycetes bacterium]|nr:mycothiol synthase [Actinomycetes bacterium]